MLYSVDKEVKERKTKNYRKIDDNEGCEQGSLPPLVAS